MLQYMYIRWFVWLNVLVAKCTSWLNEKLLFRHRRTELLYLQMAVNERWWQNCFRAGKGLWNTEDLISVEDSFPWLSWFIWLITLFYFWCCFPTLTGSFCINPFVGTVGNETDSIFVYMIAFKICHKVKPTELQQHRIIPIFFFSFNFFFFGWSSIDDC